MAINSIGQNAALYAEPETSTAVENKTALDKDDFMTLLLVELQHQDPTEPMDSDKILSQTSQLASLEASDNTNKALEELAASLAATNDFSTISAIGKTADLGSNAIVHDEGSISTFEMYFPADVEQGSVQIVDGSGSIVKTLEVGTNPSGVYKFDWDGTTNVGGSAEDGLYYINASYTTPDGQNLETRLGAYPIESVKFDGGKTLVKLGSSYVPLENIKEVY
jgi:flagellar basal-body rod modification protein FlgD